MIIDIIVSVIFCFIILLLIVWLADTLFPSNKWGCKMGWHKQPKNISNDGCSNCGECSCCGKEVMQDSQGNWF